MRVKDVTDTYVMGVPLNILRLIGGDFDGDVLNILAVKDKVIDREFELKFNPRKSMMIDRKDGKINRAMGLIKNQSIILNEFNYL